MKRWEWLAKYMSGFHLGGGGGGGGGEGAKGVCATLKVVGVRCTKFLPVHN